MIYALISKETSIVVNVIAYDGKTPYEPAEGLYLLKSDDLQIGDKV
jgi:hypothetical protein